jgi:SAM-dependent methyltransferase
VVGDGGDLPLAGSTLDFVVALHLLEHLPDPLGALAEWYRALRPGGILLLSVPDQRFWFDRLRPRTALEHLVADHGRRCRRVDLEHYREWTRLTEPVTCEAAMEERARELEARQYPIHAHVWTAGDVSDLIDHARATRLAPFELRKWQDGGEITVLLQKPPCGGRPAVPGLWPLVRRVLRGLALLFTEGPASVARRMRLRW